MSMDRREFVQRVSQTAAAVAAVAVGAPVLSPRLLPALESKPMAELLPIIDTHQHLWDLKEFKLPWLAEAKSLARSYVTKDYLAAVEGLNVVKAIYMEVDVTPEQQVEEAEHLIGLSKDKANLTVAAVISGRPASPKFRDYLARFRDQAAIKGIRQVLHGAETPPGTCVKPEYIAGIKALGEMKLSFDLCMRPTELTDAAKLIDACPETQFILDHCGNADPNAFEPAKKRLKATDEKPTHEADAWRRDIESLAKRKNLVCKISGIVARAKPGAWGPEDLAPIVNHCLDQFGPDRVIFGSDWPVCTLAASLKEWVDALRQIIAPRAVAEQRKLLHDNAAQLYRV